jgi:DNA-binding transcriptional regulator YhcF (GntR family)
MSTRRDDKPSVDEPANLDAVAIDRDAEVPIGVQLAWALRSRIDDGELIAGQRLPGLRDLAEAIGVNVNTVRAVYQRLEQEGLITSLQGSGTFVTATPTQPSAIGAIVASAAREALETGVDPREVAAALYVAGELSQPDGEDEASERRRLLRAQIAALERALGEMEASHPGVAPPSASARAGIGPALLSAEELEQVRTYLVRRLAAVQSAIDAQLNESATATTPARAKPRTEADAAAAKLDQQAAVKPARRPPRPRGGTRPAPAGT